MSEDAAEFGARTVRGGTRFSLWSGAGEHAWVCLFDAESGEETARIEMARAEDGIFSATVKEAGPGTRYGYRVDGRFAPHEGHRFDPAKLLVDPYAHAIDRPFAYDPRLAAPREEGIDTAPLMPKSVVTTLPRPKRPAAPKFTPGGLVYELNVRGFTMRHPDIPERLRGTVAALAEPPVIEHLKKLGVSAVELMPIVAWIDERHLPPLGLTNAWGYNPVAYFVPDPRICPGGIAELAETTKALHKSGIGVILDVVYNHTGESDAIGPTLSLRGVDNAAYFRHAADGTLINDTGCGNTLACDHPMVRRLVLESLRHFVRYAGVDGFRFDLAPILGRSMEGFSAEAALLQEIAADPVLSTRIMIAEPWDIGPGGYQLGQFPDGWLEWNDRFRDRVRRFWRGDGHMLGPFASALAGSSDSFTGKTTRSVNFIAAHDGFPLADLTTYAHKHNEANGEENRDGHNDNLSWNNGVEGPTDDPDILGARRADIMAMLATLFASRGTIMLTAGDEFGRTQQGNNNAYAQDNEIAWIDWEGRDRDLETFTAELSTLRRRTKVLSGTTFLSGETDETGIPDVAWHMPNGNAMEPENWEDPGGSAFAMILRNTHGARLAVLFNRSVTQLEFELPSRDGYAWSEASLGKIAVPARSVRLVREGMHKGNRSKRNATV
ncbi:glycogen debranching protein GlgX [Amaricoccus macauensis]|uniref:glycogen debranching protein GlgX n=1 Tax=Amaricoccus macauensis TaxID=57001 RepID=UPI003C7B1BDC